MLLVLHACGRFASGSVPVCRLASVAWGGGPPIAHAFGMGHAALNAFLREGELHPLAIERDVIASVAIGAEHGLIGEVGARGDVGDCVFHVLIIAQPAAKVKGFGPVVTLVHTARGAGTYVPASGLRP